MNKEEFKAKHNELRDALTKLREDYIEANKPCNIGDHVEIILASGRVVSGVVLEFSLLGDKDVCISSYKSDQERTQKTGAGKVKFITTPHKNVRVL